MTTEINNPEKTRTTGENSGIGHINYKISVIKLTAKKTVIAKTAKLSDKANVLQHLESRIDKLPAVNLQKVTKIRQAINRGSYETNAERIAKKIIEMENLIRDKD